MSDSSDPTAPRWHSDGDSNTSPLRAEWQGAHVDPATRRRLDEDARYFLRQALSTPCLGAALKDQLDALPFAPRRFTCESAVALTRKLVGIAPAPLCKVLFAPGGSEAIEIALKIARAATGRHKTISFWDAFHGAGFAASGVGSESLFRSGSIGPLIAGAEHVAPFACYRCRYGYPAPGGRPELDVCGMAP